MARALNPGATRYTFHVPASLADALTRAQHPNETRTDTILRLLHQALSDQTTTTGRDTTPVVHTAERIPERVGW